MSPEQVLGHDAMAGPTCSVGVVLYLLTGSPLQGRHNDCHVAEANPGAPVALDWHRKGLPDWCGTILQRALAKSPADRFKPPRIPRDARQNGRLVDHGDDQIVFPFMANSR
jgi:hypothetical protein